MKSIILTILFSSILTMANAQFNPEKPELCQRAFTPKNKL